MASSKEYSDFEKAFGSYVRGASRTKEIIILILRGNIDE